MLWNINTLYIKGYFINRVSQEKKSYNVSISQHLFYLRSCDYIATSFIKYFRQLPGQLIAYFRRYDPKRMYCCMNKLQSALWIPWASFCKNLTWKPTDEGQWKIKAEMKVKNNKNKRSCVIYIYKKLHNTLHASSVPSYVCWNMTNV